MVQQGAERPALAGLVREAVEFPSRRRNFPSARSSSRTPGSDDPDRDRRRALAAAPRSVKPRDADPAPLPVRQRLVAGRALDEIPSRVDPTECERQPVAEFELLVRPAQTRTVPGAASPNSLAAAAALPRGRHGSRPRPRRPRSRAARPAGLAERPDARSPSRWRNRASFWRARMAAESGSKRPRRDRQPLAGQPVGDPVEGPKTRIAPYRNRAHSWSRRPCSRTGAPPAAPRLPARGAQSHRRQRGRAITRVCALTDTSISSDVSSRSPHSEQTRSSAAGL